MVILVLEHVPAGVRGELSRWLLEPRAGVFVGNLSALVRDRLWEHVCEHARVGGALLLSSSSETEQGYTIRVWGEPAREVVEMDGLWLMRTPTTPT